MVLVPAAREGRADSSQEPNAMGSALNHKTGLLDMTNLKSTSVFYSWFFDKIVACLSIVQIMKQLQDPCPSCRPTAAL